MNEAFELPVLYNGEENLLDAIFVKTAYSYQIKVHLPQGTIVFEPDEEGSYRAMDDHSEPIEGTVDAALLLAIVKALETAFK